MCNEIHISHLTVHSSKCIACVLQWPIALLAWKINMSSWSFWQSRLYVDSFDTWRICPWRFSHNARVELVGFDVARWTRTSWCESTTCFGIDGLFETAWHALPVFPSGLLWIPCRMPFEILWFVDHLADLSLIGGRHSWHTIFGPESRDSQWLVPSCAGQQQTGSCWVGTKPHNNQGHLVL